MIRPLLAFLAATMLASTAAHAGSAVVLWPVDPVIGPKQQATALWIENRGDKPVTLQVRSLGWRQDGGENDYVQQDEVVSSPPAAEVAPGQRQLVRIIRRTTTPPQGERAFRLLIDELPAPIDPAAPGLASAALAVQMRYSIPLFTYGAPAQRDQPVLAVRLIVDGGRRFAEIRNDGGRHARLTDLRIVSQGHSTTIAPGLVGYVLGGATMRWPIPDSTPLDASIVVGVDGADQTLGHNV